MNRQAHSSPPGGHSTSLDDLIGASMGLRLRAGEAPKLGAWLGERAQRQGLHDLGAYAAWLKGSSVAARDERERLSARLTTGETYFFRDRGQFDLLAQTLIPTLHARNAGSRRLWLWSAGCSTGEEAYSLAMLLDELPLRLDGWDVRILATDINREALAIAEAGVYGDWSFRALDPGRKARCFHREGTGWRIADRFRERVRFARFDLLHDRLPEVFGMAAVDLIVCRNVFIYMQPQAIAQVAHGFADVLAEQGYLVTGHGELLGHNTRALHTRVYAESVVLQKGEAGEAPALPEAPLPTAVGPAGATQTSAPPALRRAVNASTQSLTHAPAAPSVRPAESAASRAGPAHQADLSLAWALANRGEAEAARRACAQACLAVPLDPWPYYLLAQLDQERGDVVAARRHLHKALYLAPDCVAASLELAALSQAAGETERAAGLLRSTLRQLEARPADAVVPPYGRSTAGEMQTYVRNRLAALSAPASSVDGA